MLRILHDTKIDFMGSWKGPVFGIFLFLIPAIFLIILSGLNVGIEFTGGTLAQIKFKTAPDIADVRKAVSDAGLAGAEVTTFGGPDEIVVRAQGEEEAAQASATAGAVVAEIRAALTERFGADSFEIERTELIGPRVGSELRRNAVIAMLVSFMVSLIYLAWRFDWRLALASIVTNIHDILATFAFIRYMGIEINLFVIGGILTVIGYSLADTVVVFDRVRELLRHGDKRALRDTLNAAVNETLPRTVMTGTTVLACLLALIFLGGEVLRPFAWVLLFGIIVGTMSSIYVAGPVLMLIERKWPRPTRDGRPRPSAPGASNATPPRPARPKAATAS
jgi:preprotein translocase subunit SecF